MSLLDLVAQVFHRKSCSQTKIAVTALDIDPTHEDDALRRFPDIVYLVSHVADVQDTHDVVTCLHPSTPNPSRHLSSFDERFFAAHPSDHIEVCRSHTCRQETVSWPSTAPPDE